jgi:hypothetical protein
MRHNAARGQVLERFAETTGGRVFFPSKLSEVADAFTQIQDELRSQYVLSLKGLVCPVQLPVF